MIKEIDTSEQLKAIAVMADEIWHDAYAGIITEAQILYMLDKFQSFEAMQKQMAEEGYRYFIISHEGKDAGYCGIKVDDEGKMYLSKMYLRRSARGLGLFDEMLDTLKDICRKGGIRYIWLTVNKHNDRAVAAYIKNGFTTIRDQVGDIGQGFVMDDYVMQLTVAG